MPVDGNGRSRPKAGEHHRSAILDVIRRHHFAHQDPPTIRELAEAVGISRTTVSHHLARLEERGAIERTPGLARGIRYLPEGRPLRPRRRTTGGTE